jgi:chromosome segregation ATPase
MTMEIPRFTDRLLAGELQESPLGAWVRYADHAAALAHTCAERDVAQANYQFMVDRACNEKLDGYRELGARCAALSDERDAVRAEANRLRGALAQVAARLGFDAGASIEQVLHALDYALAERKGAERRADDAELEVKRLTGRLALAEHHRAEAQHSVKRAAAHADALVARHTRELSERDRALEGALADLAMARTGANMRTAEVEALRTEVATLKRDIEQAQRSIHGYRERACAVAVQHDHDRREWASTLERARSEVAILQCGDRAGQAEVADLRAQVCALEAAAKHAHGDGREAMLAECVAALRQRAQDVPGPGFEAPRHSTEVMLEDAAFLEREVTP